MQRAAARHAATLAAWHEKDKPHKERLNRHVEDTVQKTYTDTKLVGGDVQGAALSAGSKTW